LISCYIDHNHRDQLPWTPRFENLKVRTTTALTLAKSSLKSTNDVDPDAFFYVCFQAFLFIFG
ncbi:hypothetical protein RRG08_020052, partial [Elysia crispata]